MSSKGLAYYRIMGLGRVLLLESVKLKAGVPFTTNLSTTKDGGGMALVL